ncbi:hypothetical protein KJ713_03310 [Patescibacteria group bacterium]|nr:hypothetical protein [Patescibacteria group bacterium]
MTRNLGRTSCDRCGHPVVKLDSEPRLITRKEAGIDFDMFEGLMVAEAHCPICKAKYLAWVDETQTSYYGHPMGSITHPNRVPEGYFDLSYESTFNNRPSEHDIIYNVLVDEVPNIITTFSSGVVVIQTVKVVRLTIGAAV